MATENLSFLITARDLASKEFGKVGRAAKEAESGLGKFKTGGKVALLGVGIAAAAFAKSSINAYDDVGRQTLRLQRTMGGTAESASRLIFAAKESGLGFEDLSKSMGIFSKHVAANDKAFASIGVSAKDAAGNLIPMDQLLPQIAQKFAEMPNGTEKTAEALKLFGRNGLALLPFLNKGAAGISELEKESDKFGTTLSGKDTAAVKENIIAKRQLAAAAEGLQISLGRALFPAITQVAHGMQNLTHFITDNERVLKPAAEVALAFAGSVLAINRAARAVTATRAAFTTIGGLTKTLRGGAVEAGTAATRFARIGGILGKAGPWGAGLAVGATLLATFFQSHHKVLVDSQDYAGTLDKETGAITGNTRALVAQNLASSGAIDAAAKLGIAGSQLVDAYLNPASDSAKAVSGRLHDLDAALEANRNQTGNNYEAAHALRGAMGTVSDALGEGASQAEKHAKAMRIAAEAEAALKGTVVSSALVLSDQNSAVRRGAMDIERYAPAVTTAGGAQEGWNARINPTKAALIAEGGAVRALTKDIYAQSTALSRQAASDAAIQARKDLTAALKANHSAFTGTTDAALADRQAVRNWVDATKASIRASGGHTLAMKHAADALAALYVKHGMAASAAHNQAYALYGLRDAVKSVPTPKNVKVGVTGVSAAKATVIGFQRLLNSLHDKHVNVMVGVTGLSAVYAAHAAAQSLGGHALGGSYDPSRPFLAGERGPEIVDPAMHRVYTAKQTAAMVGAGGGGPVRLHRDDMDYMARASAAVVLAGIDHHDARLADDLYYGGGRG